MTEALKKRVERLEKEKTPLITPEGQEIIDLLHRGEEFIEHPERFPPEDPEETERMLKEVLASGLHAKKMETKGSVIN